MTFKIAKRSRKSPKGQTQVTFDSYWIYSYSPVQVRTKVIETVRNIIQSKSSPGPVRTKVVETVRNNSVQVQSSPSPVRTKVVETMRNNSVSKGQTEVTFDSYIIFDGEFNGAWRFDLLTFRDL